MTGELHPALTPDLAPRRHGLTPEPAVGGICCRQENVLANQSKAETVCEVVGVFHYPGDLESAIDDLLNSGFYRAELSVLACETAVAEKLGGFYHPPTELADDASVLGTAFVSGAAIGDAKGALISLLRSVGATVAIGSVSMPGALGAAITTVVLAGSTGRLVGSVFAHWVGHHHAAYLREHIENGGLLLCVRALGKSDEARAFEIIATHAPDNVDKRNISALRA